MFFGAQGMYAPASHVDSVSFLTNRSLLQRRSLICLMPRHVPEQDIAWGSLSKLDWQVPFGAGPVGISLNAKARLSPAAKALIGYLEQAAAEQS
ncbi:hypothetical protein [Phaeobacter inhibens]|nr:hypothetical protein [Phaeobacter inhibens]